MTSEYISFTVYEIVLILMASLHCHVVRKSDCSRTCNHETLIPTLIFTAEKCFEA